MMNACIVACWFSFKYGCLFVNVYYVHSLKFDETKFLFFIYFRVNFIKLLWYVGSFQSNPKYFKTNQISL